LIKQDKVKKKVEKEKERVSKKDDENKFKNQS
jgi:hypothetical protein